MTEEVVKTEGVVENAAETVDPIEQEARKDGWRPKEEWDGDENQWIPADEFVRRKPLFSKISDLKSENFHTRRELQEVKQTLKSLAEHHKRVRQVEYERALKELQTARRDALDERDHDSAIQLEEKIDQLKEEKRDFEQELKKETTAQAQPTPEYLEWVKENQWYLQDSDMHADADAIAIAHLQKNGGKVSPNDLYKHVSEKIRKLHPEKFQSASSERRPSPVESGRSEARPPKKEAFRLTEEQELAMRNFVKQGLMTRDEYIAELKKIEEK